MLRLERVVVRYGEVLALSGADLEVAEGERVTVLGPSGSGKTTLLRAIAGLERPDAGTISWAGRDLASVPAHARGFGLMFQEYVLFPHADVGHNVGFGLRMRGERPAAIAARVAEVLAMVGLSGYGRRRVTELSGGEQQRVALARALAPSPRLLMLDEPLAALDRTLRLRLTDELDELFQRLRLTILYVTHDQEEALALGDRVAVMRDGRVEAALPPEELWRRPPTEFVARFMGMPNVCLAQVDPDGLVETPWGLLRSPIGLPAGEQRLLLRPDAFVPVAEGPLCGTVSGRTFRGQRVIARLAVEGAERGAPALVIHADWPSVPRQGERLCVDVTPASVVLLGRSNDEPLT